MKQIKENLKGIVRLPTDDEHALVVGLIDKFKTSGKRSLLFGTLPLCLIIVAMILTICFQTGLTFLTLGLGLPLAALFAIYLCSSINMNKLAKQHTESIAKKHYRVVRGQIVPAEVDTGNNNAMILHGVSDDDFKISFLCEEAVTDDLVHNEFLLVVINKYPFVIAFGAERPSYCFYNIKINYNGKKGNE